MQESDFDRFDRALKRLCAGFDTPPTDARRDAYWRSFRKLTILEFSGLVDMALTESSFTSMPTVGVLWDLHRKLHASDPAPSQQMGPTLQEQLMAWASSRAHAMMKRGEITPLEFSRPWTFCYREWHDSAKPKHLQRCAECIGVVLETDDGRRIGFSVADMQAPAAFQGAA